ncbi:unnamed protein product [Effrenium voratum]|nr:unnamed protein product [Effrenium voratum]
MDQHRCQRFGSGALRNCRSPPPPSVCKMQLITLWFSLCLQAASGYRFADEAQLVRNESAGNESAKPSLRAFDFRGFSDKLVIKLTNGSQIRHTSPFLAIPGLAQNNPCKLQLYGDAKRVLIRDVKEVKATSVAMVKTNLIQFCKLVGDTVLACTKLGLDTEAGRLKMLSAKMVEEEKFEGPKTREEAGHEEESPVALTTEAPGSLPRASELKELALFDVLQSSVQMYSCMVSEGEVLAEAPAKKGMFESGWNKFRRGVQSIRSDMKGGPIGRLSKKLAGYTHGVCPPFAKCHLWRALLAYAMAGRESQPESCEVFLTRKGLMELKGDPTTRIGMVDLSALDLGAKQRKVQLEETGNRQLELKVHNTLEEGEQVSSVYLGKKIDSSTADISSPWVVLLETLRARASQCQVEKVGVFNLGLKKRWNGFQLSERLPWKMMVLFSRAAIQIFSRNAQGQGPTAHFGYDLYGDPQEIERPCRWMQKARERGYEPRSSLFFAEGINFENAGFKVKFPKWLYAGDNHSLLWTDAEGKFPLPDWVRGMRKLWDVNASKLPSWLSSFSDGRSLNHYKDKAALDPRGLHSAQDALPVFLALRRLGWAPDPVVRISTKQTESPQMSAHLVTSVFPFNKKLSGLQSLPTDPLRHGGENALWSVYDYTESYFLNCFVLEAMSLPTADDGVSDLGGELTASITLCTNSWSDEQRSAVPASSKVARADIMEELIDFFSRDRPRNMQVSAKIKSSCYSEADCTGNTCMGPSDCKENEDNPCPVGYGCGCDASSNQMLFTAALGASMLTETVQNTMILGPAFVATCETIALGGAAFTGGLSLGLVPLCPILAPLFFLMLSPFGSDVLLAFIFASIVGGLNKCGCIPLECSSSSLIHNNVCALHHPQGEEEEMLNPYHFVPPPKKKCAPGTIGCSLQQCNETELSTAEMGWHAEGGRLYGRHVGIYNCKAGPWNASDGLSAFDHKAFMEQHQDWEELKENLVPQVQAPKKLSFLQESSRVGQVVQ